MREIAPGYPSGGRRAHHELILDELRVLAEPAAAPARTARGPLPALCRHIQVTLAQPWTLEQAAERPNVSGCKPSRRFQRETGLQFAIGCDFSVYCGAERAGDLTFGAGSGADLGYDSPSAVQRHVSPGCWVIPL